MCFLWSKESIFICQETAFFINTAVKTSNMTYCSHDCPEVCDVGSGEKTVQPWNDKQGAKVTVGLLCARGSLAAPIDRVEAAIWDMAALISCDIDGLPLQTATNGPEPLGWPTQQARKLATPEIIDGHWCHVTLLRAGNCKYGRTAVLY
jgi:hypothetical protein